MKCQIIVETPATRRVRSRCFAEATKQIGDVQVCRIHFYHLSRREGKAPDMNNREVKATLGKLVREALEERGDLFWGKVQGFDFLVDVTKVDDLTTQIKLTPKDGPRRYFTVKLTEH